MLIVWYRWESVNKPTRVTKTSAAIIDHIWTNNIENGIKGEIIIYSTTDNFPVISKFCVCLSRCVTSDCFTFTSTKFTTEATEAFIADLCNYVYDPSNLIAVILNALLSHYHNFQRLHNWLHELSRALFLLIMQKEDHLKISHPILFHLKNNWIKYNLTLPIPNLT